MTPLALLALGAFGVALIHSGQFSAPRPEGEGLAVWLRQVGFRQVVVLGLGPIVLHPTGPGNEGP